MKQAIASMLLSAAIACAGTAGRAAEPDPRAEDRKELVKVFRAIESAINAQDVDAMTGQMAPEAVVTWLNGEVSRGHAEIKAYYQKMVKGEKRILDKYTTQAKLGAPANFYGDGTVAVADGTTVDEFFPVARGPFKLDSNWTATCAKVNGQWKVVALHLSSNVFTNSLIGEAKEMIWKAAAGGVLVGLVLAWLLGRLRRGRT